MIIDKKINLNLIRLHKKTIKYYNDLGYDTNCDVIIVDIEDLHKNSRIIINVCCDFCKKDTQCSYSIYNTNISKGNKYSCSKKCGREKAKVTNMEKWGVDNPSKSEIIKKKKEETSLKNFGVSTPLKSKTIIEKAKVTNMKKWGVDNPSKSEIIKKKKEETNLKNFGVKNPFQSEDVKNKIKETNIKKWGVDNPSKSSVLNKKKEETNIEKYGFTHPMMSDDIKNKIKETNIEKYGVDVFFKSDKFKDEYKITSMRNYGFTHPMMSNTYKEKIRNIYLNKYGCDSITKNEEFRKLNYGISNNEQYIKYLNDGISLFYCEKGHNFEINSSNYFSRKSSNIKLCTICNPISNQSSFKENELLNFIKSIYTGNIISRYRDKLEIDIYIPDLKLGIEFNGLYWHCDKFVDKFYHLNKINYFKEKGIRLINIWEDDWDFKKEIVKSQIINTLKINKIKIHARKCQVVELFDKKLINIFLEENHIQGYVNSSIKIGLFYNNQLVSLMTFDKMEGRKKMEDGGWNLNRYCSKLGNNIVGGASKILSYFIKTYSPNRIISYADSDWSTGDLYYKLEFEKISQSGPDYKYIIGKKRVHKSNFKKSKIKYESTEYEYMKSIGVNRIWDSGKMKFEKLY